MPVVEAVATATSKNGKLSEICLAAMNAAITDCYARGIIDPDEIKAAKMAAYDSAKQKFLAEQAEAQEGEG